MNRYCYLCGAQDFVSVEGKVRDIPEMGILKCKKCGLVFLENFDHIDDHFYEESKMRLNSAVKDWEIYIENTFCDDSRRAKSFKSLVANKSVLDFGCGAGGFLSQIKEETASCFGLEKDKSLIPIIKEKFGIDVYYDIDDIKEKFDVITLFHVLEHFKDPEATLKRLSKLLNINGVIIVEVPNSNDALLTVYKSKAFSEFTYWGCHLYLFNNENLSMLIEKSGFSLNSLKQIQRYPLSNHLFWLAQGKSGGHKIWEFLNADELSEAYEKELEKVSSCDTIVASIKRKS